MTIFDTIKDKLTMLQDDFGTDETPVESDNSEAPVEEPVEEPADDV